MRLDIWTKAQALLASWLGPQSEYFGTHDDRGYPLRLVRGDVTGPVAKHRSSGSRAHRKWKRTRAAGRH